MKNSRVVVTSLLALAVASTAMAATSFPFQKIEMKSIDGTVRAVSCPNGACVVDNLAPGRYTLRLLDAQGKSLSADADLVYRIVSPRDAASGLPTGKRMHKPIRIYAQLGKSAAPSEIAIDESGVHLAIGVDAEATDAAVARINTSRSNIKQ